MRGYRVSGVGCFDWFVAISNFGRCRSGDADQRYLIKYRRSVAGGRGGRRVSGAKWWERARKPRRANFGRCTSRWMGRCWKHLNGEVKQFPAEEPKDSAAGRSWITPRVNFHGGESEQWETRLHRKTDADGANWHARAAWRRRPSSSYSGNLLVENRTSGMIVRRGRFVQANGTAATRRGADQ